ncbi:hypothetical protein JHK84_043301 [Glycine max]|nr:hypothetical protein JHK84_043301 [Glycine max]
MDGFSPLVVQIRNLNPKVAFHSMLLALRLGKFVDSCSLSASAPDRASSIKCRILVRSTIHALSQRRMAQLIMRSAREGRLSQLGDIWLSTPLLRLANHALIQRRMA